MSQTTAPGKNDFSQGSLFKHIMRMALPMLVAQAVNILYNLTDRFFLGRIPAVGDDVLAGVGLVFPVMVIYTAVANMFGLGGGTLCSMDRGRGDLDHAGDIQANAFAMLVLSGLGMSGAFLLTKRWLLPLMGASAVTYPYADGYLTVWLLGSVFQLVSLGMNPFINAQGFARTGMATVLLGAGLNILLDPLFIFTLDMGAAGAALATVLAQFVSFLWVMAFLLGRRAIIPLNLKRYRLRLAPVGQICALGFASFVGYLTNAVVNLLSNAQLALYGGDVFVGVMTIISALREALTLVANGMVNGAGPVLGYNYGAQQYKRVAKCIRIVLVLTVVCCSAAWLPAMLAPEGLIRIFNDEPELLSVGRKAVLMYFSCFFALGLQAAGQVCYLSLGMKNRAMFFSLLRKMVLGVPLILLLPLRFGAYGVYLAEPVTELVAGLLNLAMLLYIHRRLLRLPEGEPIGGRL